MIIYIDPFNESKIFGEINGDAFFSGGGYRNKIRIFGLTGIKTTIFFSGKTFWRNCGT
jgi:hypothetical protein